MDHALNRRALLAALGLAAPAPWLAACGGGGGSGDSSGVSPPSSSSSSSSSSSASSSLGAPATNDALLLDIHHRTFNLFWECTETTFGLMPDRWPTPSAASIAGCGFALTANVIGAINGYISRADAAARTHLTLNHFATAPQGTATSGTIGYKGFFYHFLDITTGLRSGTTELSSIDTALFLMGALTAAQYFTSTADPVETDIRALAQTLYQAVDWTFLLRSDGGIGQGWTPESGPLTTEWIGYSEGILVYLLALASPTFPVPTTSWTTWTSGYDANFGTVYGQTYLNCPALFTQQYPHVWYDFRGIADAYMRGKGFDYFENSRRATLAQREYGRENPQGFTGYAIDMWGFTACDGPANATINVAGVNRTFETYAARGFGPAFTFDDGTIAPTAALSSLNFAPAEAYQAVQALKTRYGSDIYGTYGFFDAFNPTYPSSAASTTGHTTASGWVGTDYLAIDQGPILAMLENYMSGSLWTLMRASPVVKLGLQRAGFQSTSSAGAWLGA